MCHVDLFRYLGWCSHWIERSHNLGHLHDFRRWWWRRRRRWRWRCSQHGCHHCLRQRFWIKQRNQNHHRNNGQVEGRCRPHPLARLRLELAGRLYQRIFKHFGTPCSARGKAGTVDTGMLHFVPGFSLRGKNSSRLRSGTDKAKPRLARFRIVDRHTNKLQIRLWVYGFIPKACFCLSHRARRYCRASTLVSRAHQVAVRV